MPMKCLSCGAEDDDDNNRPFFRLPKDNIKRLIWLQQLGIEHEPVVTSVLCSDHFLATDIIRDSRGEPYLKEDAYPLKTPLLLGKTLETPVAKHQKEETSFRIKSEDDGIINPSQNSVDCHGTATVNNEDLRGSSNFLDIVLSEPNTKLRSNSIEIVDNELDCVTNDWKETIRCRTCLSTDLSKQYFKVKDVCLKHISIWNAILMIVPNLKVDIIENDFICDSCLNSLKNAVSFVFKCLEADNALWEELDTIEKKDNSLSFQDIVEDHEVFGNDNEVFGNDHEVSGNEHEVSEDDQNPSQNESDLATENTSTIAIDNKTQSSDLVESMTIKCPRIKDTDKTVSEQTIAQEAQFWNQLASCYKVQKEVNTVIPDNINLYSNPKLLSVGPMYNFDVSGFLKNMPKRVQIIQCGNFDGDGGKQRILLLGSVFYKKCPACDVSFASESKLKDHFETDHQDVAKTYLVKPFIKPPIPGSLRCDHCRRSFKTSEMRQVHSATCTILNCPYCTEFLPEDVFSAHIQKKHSKPFPFKCLNCKQQFLYYRVFKAHRCDVVVFGDVKKPTREKIAPKKSLPVKKPSSKNTKCQVCHELIPHELFKMHTKLHGVDLHRVDFICSICGQTFRTEANMRKHEMNHTTQLCFFCGKLIPVKIFQFHIALHDEKADQKFKCSFCSKSFSLRYHLTRHEKNHRKPMAICEKCGIKCLKSCLGKHYQTRHSEMKNYDCTLCPKKFSRKDYLERHLARHGVQNNYTDKIKYQPKKPEHLRRKIMRYKVKAGEPVSCKICGKMFKSIHVLKVHLDNHMNFYRHKCRYCSMSYSSPSNRLRHEKLHRSTPNYKFRCHTCWKMFPNQEELDLHESSTHSNKYSCEECGKKFSRKFALTTHVVQTHYEKEELEQERQNVILETLQDYINS